LFAELEKAGPGRGDQRNGPVNLGMPIIIDV
jgi:hypothetical protein